MALTTQLRTRVGGLRGPGLTDADLVLVNAAAVQATIAAQSAASSLAISAEANATSAEALDVAEQALETAASGSLPIYVSEAAAEAATSNGDYFQIEGSPHVWKNVAGNAVVITERPTYADVLAVTELLLPAPSGGDDSTMINAVLSLAGLGGLYIRARKGALYTISERLVVKSYTTLDMSGARVKLLPSSFTNMLVNWAFTQARTSVTVTWSSAAPLDCLVAWTAHSLSLGDYVWLTGPNSDPTWTLGPQAQFRGVFCVVAVTDANNAVLRLRRIPTSAPRDGAGSTVNVQCTAIKADRSIHLIGGDWDMDEPNNQTAAPNFQPSFMNIFAGVEGLTLEGRVLRNAARYSNMFSACTNVRIRNEHLPWSGGDGYHFFGSIFDLDADNITGMSDDDFFVLDSHMTWDDYPTTFADWGDILHVRVRNVRPYKMPTTPTPLRVYASSGGPYGPNEGGIVDDVAFIDCEGWGGPTGSGVFWVGNIDPDTAVNGVVGSLSVTGLSGYGLGAFRASQVTIDRLDLGVRDFQTISASGSIADIDPDSVVNQVRLVDWDIEDTTHTGAAFANRGTIGTITTNGNCRYKGSATGKFIHHTGTAGKNIGSVDVSNGNDITGQYVFLTGAGASFTGTPKISVRNNLLNLTGGGVVRLAHAADVNISGNSGTVTSVLITDPPASGTVTVNYEISEDNRFSATPFWLNNPTSSANILTVPYGDQIAVNIVVAYLGRADAAHCRNTNAAIGTITTAGVVDCMGTATWCRRGDPVAQRYTP